NDPPQDIVVIRDLAWYAFGSDYITPEFSANTLSIAERHAFHENGKLTEFIRANEEPAALHDYGLNINDDTPLYVCALFHHALLGNSSYTPESAYPPMKRACDYILSQVEDGLVRCHSNGTNVWGICGWRNIIDGYNLTGAVTEINCECYYALRCTADVAAHIGRIEESRRYLRAAERLRDEVNEKLVSEKTGLYLLNLADDGTRHHDITGDLIFPVLFGVAEPAMKKKILKKLTEADIWTPFGARTVSKNEANYDPDLGCQLLGGVWPNLTAWIAYCVREENPAKLVEGMLNIYKLSEPERPADFVNVVPGEFPERLHGETFESRGMAMSPWMPPTYVWLAIEGLFGVRSSLGGLIMNPAIPPNWNWIAVRNLPYNGMTISAFVLEGVIYSNIALKSSLPVKTGELVEAFADNDSILCIAIKIAEEIAVFAASDEGGDGTISIVQDGFIISESISLARGEAKLFSISTKVRVEER
ncbi:MAG TPA: amylo-alpha-1,6-glucosidase, partial [Bacteroidota bacterium]|nr:amylo-alpha-1,6-glucosidase [Bacteroidota bacterium]